MRRCKKLSLLTVSLDGKREFTLVNLPGELGSGLKRLPFSLRVVAENLLRQSLDSEPAGAALEHLYNWTATSGELVVPLKVSRVIFPDSSGLPALMDLAAARDAVQRCGLPPDTVEPTVPVTLVIDHSLIVDYYGQADSEALNVAREYERNKERYAFFKWAQQAFSNLEVVPPGNGIIHQVHLERLARLVAEHHVKGIGSIIAPEFVLGSDSHTPMVNGMGLLAWGAGGIEVEAAALGEPHVVRIPRVVGVRLTNRLPAGSTTTDMVLTITQRLRKLGVVGAFVEFCGEGIDSLSVPDRATIANMAPEYGATIGFFPIDDRTIEYLEQSGRAPDHVALVEAYAHAAGLFAQDKSQMPEFSELIEIDLSAIVPCLAGPKRPQDRVPLGGIKDSFRNALRAPVAERGFGLDQGALEKSAECAPDGKAFNLTHGSVVIAAITSCTNTSNPGVMLGAGLLARNAVAMGLVRAPWVKTSLAPGSRLVHKYLENAGLMEPLEALGFHVVGYGCTTCSGKSGPIDPKIEAAIVENDLVAVAVLSGNRNFEGRIHKTCRASYLASPPLVVAFALAGRINIDFETEPLGRDQVGKPVFLRDIWPEGDELARLVRKSQQPSSFCKSYATLFDGGELWDRLEVPQGSLFKWDEASSYIKRPPFFEIAAADPGDQIEDARVLCIFGDSLTTDHITPSGEILPESQAGQYLIEAGVAPRDFNAVTQRRGNHEFMARITFASQRLKNRLTQGIEGGVTRLAPGADPVTIYDAAQHYLHQGTPVIVLAGKDYGMGSSRDWAAKGPMLLGVKAVLARSFERIHRANLIGMGIVPLLFEQGSSIESLGLTGFESFTFSGLAGALVCGDTVSVRTMGLDGVSHTFSVQLDIASPHERELMRVGGIFPKLLASVCQPAQVQKINGAAP